LHWRLKEVIQYDATDWDFLVCRTEANGQVVAVRDGKVTVASPATGAAPVVTARCGAAVLESDAEIDASCQPTGITATSWSQATQNVPEVNAAEPAVTASGNLAAQDLAVTPPAAAGLLPAVRGLQLGVVTALQGDPDGEDRIKVRLPLVSPSQEGTWARLATLDAGSSRGTYFRPEIGDEVVVGFLGNDPRFPLVLGMCHSSAKPAPEPATDDNHHKGYVSRSKIRLHFDDDTKSLVLETPAGNKLVLSEADKRITIADQNGSSITLDTGGVTIKSAKNLILKAANKITIEGAANLELKAQNGFKAACGQSAEITGPTTTINGDASTVIKSAIVRIN
jgi:uncharacterized protein involved in type VI secretion and phage assembly